MRKVFLMIAIVAFFTACNSGNEGSDSIYIDSARIADSTKMADSLQMDTAPLPVDTIAQ